jgi:catechol 2,3-dioxygenase-like lactoylglutathione lyase family enzyme
VRCRRVGAAHEPRNQAPLMNASSTVTTLPVTEHRIKPAQIAHFVIYTSRFIEAVAWYKAMLNCTATFENDNLAFLTYDDEHHRVAIAAIPGLAEQPKQTASIHHVAFTYRTLWELLVTWKRLSEQGFLPYWTVNHGPTTSMYYADPDGNRIEFQVDNFASSEEAKAYCASPEFRENSVGVEFEPEVLLGRLNAGESEAVLKRRPNIGPRSISTSRA